MKEIRNKIIRILYARINIESCFRIRIIRKNKIYIIKTDKPILVNYLNRLPNVIDIPEGSTFTWQPAILKNKLKFILLGFKDPEDSYTKNDSKGIQWETNAKRIKSLE